MNKVILILFLGAAGWLSSSVSLSALELSRLFSDGAVLQRDQPLRIWGWSEPGSEVNVGFAGLMDSTVAAPSGRWEVVLQSMPAGGPYILKVVSWKDELSREDIYMGDVWVCSGQSNMEWRLDRSYRVDSTLRSAEHTPLIRHFKIPRSWAEVPSDRVPGGEWEVFSAETGGAFSAVGLFFALEVHRVTGVPIGLLNSSWGGSRIEPWMRADVLGMEGGSVESLLEQMDQQSRDQRDRLLARIGNAGPEDQGMRGTEALWAAVDYDDSEWTPITVPSLWEAEGFQGLDGIGWYRTTFNVEPSDLKEKIVVNLGMIDDSDEVWLNGVRIGGLEDQYNAARNYPVNSEILKTRGNVLAVRVIDTGGGGGIYGDSNPVGLTVGGVTRPFPEPWKFKVGALFQLTASNPRMNHVPTVLYNAMISPIQPFPIKGVLWYQGESNASAEHAFVYRDHFKNLISSWRDQWGQGDFPFYWVQLASYENGSDSPNLSPWSVLRESQSMALSLPNTAQAVTIDIGAPRDIHPKNKHDVGFRLALAARQQVYGETGLETSGPVFQSMQVEGPKAILAFDHVTGGLESSSGGNEVSGFEIAGADGIYHPAKARIVAESIEVTAEEVPEPVSVRYAWAVNPDFANLTNGEGLPASPFRTKIVK